MSRKRGAIAGRVRLQEAGPGQLLPDVPQQGAEDDSREGQTHISRLLMKLDARDRAQLVVIAYETGLVTAPERPR